MTARHELLPECKIRELVRRYQAGDREAGDCVIAHNEAMISMIVRRYYVTGVTGDATFEDLMQLGRIGLLRAMEDYDPVRGAKLMTYAYPWIRQQISRYGRRDGQAIGMGFKARDRRGQVGKARARLEQKLSRKPTLAELAADTGLPEATIERLRVNMISIDIDPQGDQRSLADTLVDPDVDVEAEAGELADEHYNRRVHEALDGLPENWQKVIRMRYGLGCKAMTLNDVSHTMHISRERVRQIEQAALMALKKSPVLGNFE